MIAGWKNVLGSLAMIAVLAQVCRAQISPSAGVDANSPAGPPAPVSEKDIWSVDPITGALSVHIPFPTTPAGGRGPSVPFGLLYNSSSTFVFEAIGMTFSGKYPCEICKAIAEKKQSENDKICSLEKYEKKFFPPVKIALTHPDAASFQYARYLSSLQVRVEPPPTPPPRQALG